MLAMAAMLPVGATRALRQQRRVRWLRLWRVQRFHMGLLSAPTHTVAIARVAAASRTRDSASSIRWDRFA
eukprot:scaffold3540_cov147-Isochrysis_galbana.AAC.6